MIASTHRPTLIKTVAGRLLLAAGLAILLQLGICLAEFRDELYYAKHYINVEGDRLSRTASYQDNIFSHDPWSAVPHFFGHAKAAYGFRIFDERGKLLAAHNPGVFDGTTMGDVKQGQSPAEQLQKLQPEKWFYIAGRVSREIDGRRVYIDIATLGDPAKQRYYGILRDAWHDVWVPLVPTLLLTGLFALFTLRRALLPFHETLDQLEDRLPRSAIAPLDYSALPQETARLMDALDRGQQRSRDMILSQEKSFAGMLHQLRTPLHAVMLELGNSPDECARRLEADVTRMKGMIDRIQVMARLNASVVNEPAPLDLREIAETQIERLSATIESRKLQMSIRDEAPSPLIGDAGAVALALGNSIEAVIELAADGSTISITEGPGCSLTIESSEMAGSATTFDKLRAALQTACQSSDDQLPLDGAAADLAIANLATQLHGGELVLERSGTGGPRCRLQFAPNRS